MKRRALLPGTIAAGLCIAVFVAQHFVRSRLDPTPLLASDPLQWERIDIKDLPVVAAFSVERLIPAPLEPIPRKFVVEGNDDHLEENEACIETLEYFPAPPDPDYLPVFWAPDGRRLAVILPGADKDAIDVLDVNTGERQRIAPGAHVHLLTFDWHPSGERFLAGLLDKAGTIAVGDLDPANRLVEFDASSREVLREFKAEVLRGYPGWARYSPDGTKVLVTTYATPNMPPRSVPGQFVGKEVTLIIDENGAPRTIAGDGASYLHPQWNHDGTAIVHSVYDDNWGSPLAFALGEHEWEDICYCPLDASQEPEVLASVPDSFTELACYPDQGGLVRYESREVNVDLHTTKWQVWEYALSSGRRRLVLDLLGVMSGFPELDPDWAWLSFLPGNKDLCLVVEGARPTRSMNCWCISLGSRHVLGRLDLEYSHTICIYPSPDGRRLAYIDSDSAIRILEMGAVLEAIDGVVE